MKKGIVALWVMLCIGATCFFSGCDGGLLKPATLLEGRAPSSAEVAQAEVTPTFEREQAPQPTPEPTPRPTPEPTPQPTPEPEPIWCTMEWLEKYAPASVAPFEEQVGDNGDYEDVTDRPPADTYKLIVDYTNQCIYAYAKGRDGQYTKLERVMICTTGGNGNWTPEGTYNMGKDYHRFGFFVNFNCYAQYWSQMSGSFYFHSILYSSRDASTYTMSSYNNLGKPGSHGCIRLLVPDARWIYENCAPETVCTVTTAYSKNEALKNALRNGYEGAIDYAPPEEEEGDAEAESEE